MELDARQFDDNTTVETDVCIVGAGPAGLTLAAELTENGLDVLLLESGCHPTDEAAQALNEGRVIGDVYAGLRNTRHRGVGGTTGIWNTIVHGSVGAKYLPLDPIDLASWPISWSALEPYYERALGRAGVAPGSLADTSRTADRHSPIEFPHSAIVSRVYHLATRAALHRNTLGAVRSAPAVRLCTYATVIGLEAGNSGRRVHEAIVGCPGGRRFRVQADRFVLAGGAVENARLLLVSQGPGGIGLGNESGWVGRCFMEHPRDTAIRFHPSSPDFYRLASFYDVQDLPDGTSILGRLALSSEALSSRTLPNASATLLPRVRPGVTRLRSLLGPIARSSMGQRILPPGGHGWSRHRVPGMAFDGMTVLINAEQAPHPDNRIRLGAQVDAMGVPQAELHWRWTSEDQAGIEKVRELIASGLEASGLGRAEIDRAASVDPNAHHHAGTTRMHADQVSGVVDPHCRVHTIENLYVAGASVFPTAGCANPLLTILALSVRLADHLCDE